MEQTLHKIAAIENLIFIGAASLDLKLDHKRYTEWLSNGKNAGMKYLEENVEVRSNPNLLLAQTKSVLVFGMPYYQGDKWTRPGFKTPRIAMYARLKDYHKLIKKKLDLIVDKLCASNESWRRSDFRVAVDTLPLLERALANNTKTGFIGKNTCYIHPRKGSFLLLGEILSTHDFSHHSVAQRML
ncbi:MAG: DUF1730 domain-containing protein [Proteobacteria bacterium]|nr:DUF1730 domain-containing protein [Pseudomonadota bacterium]